LLVRKPRLLLLLLLLLPLRAMLTPQRIRRGCRSSY
jgi:hypothetical protein